MPALRGARGQRDLYEKSPMAKRSSSEQKKKMFLVVLGVGFLAALIYSFFLSGPAERPRRNAQTNSNVSVSGTSSGTANSAPRTRQLGAAAQQEALMQALLSDTTPLNFRFASAGSGSSKPSNRGNIFAYYVEPPTPAPPPPPPPPIQLISVTPQSAVAGTPRPVTLQITGNKIPADGQILVDGMARPTKRLNETQLTTEISAGDYSMARGITVEVKSKSDPAQNSNKIQFVVQPAPEPQFVFKGRLGSLGQPQYNYAVIEITSSREIKRVKVGDTILGVWRVDAISENSIDVTLTQYDIKRRVQLQEKPK
jgi:hypothetical protein